MSDPLPVPTTSNTFGRTKRVNAGDQGSWSARLRHAEIILAIPPVWLSKTCLWSEVFLYPLRMTPIVRTGFPMAALIAVTATPPKDGVTFP